MQGLTEDQIKVLKLGKQRCRDSQRIRSSTKFVLGYAIFESIITIVLTERVPEKVAFKDAC